MVSVYHLAEHAECKEEKLKQVDAECRFCICCFYTSFFFPFLVLKSLYRNMHLFLCIGPYKCSVPSTHNAHIIRMHTHKYRSHSTEAILLLSAAALPGGILVHKCKKIKYKFVLVCVCTRLHTCYICHQTQTSGIGLPPLTPIAQKG